MYILQLKLLSFIVEKPIIFLSVWLTCRLSVLNKICAHRLEKVNKGHPISITI